MNPAPRIVVKNTFPIGTYYVTFYTWDNKTDKMEPIGWLSWDGQHFVWEPHPGANLPADADVAGPYVRGEVSCVDTTTGNQIEPSVDPVKFLNYLNVNYAHCSRAKIGRLRRKKNPPVV